MKTSTVATFLAAAAGAFAAPAKLNLGRRNATAGNDLAGITFVFPNELANHDVTSNLNTQDFQTATVRNGNIETTTLYEFTFPAASAGKACTLVVFAGKLGGGGDNVLGTQQMDFFTTQIADLALQASGNLRDQEQARVRLAMGLNGLYEFNEQDVTPTLKEFQCPAGQTIVFESVPVGDFDINVIRQDFAPVTGATLPNGVTFAFK
jgi:hypothetical protein